MRANGRDWNVKMSLQGLKEQADKVKRNACSLVELIPWSRAGEHQQEEDRRQLAFWKMMTWMLPRYGR